MVFHFKFFASFLFSSLSFLPPVSHFFLPSSSSSSSSSSLLLDVDDHPDIDFLLLLVFEDAHGAVSDRLDLRARRVPLAVKPLPYADRLKRELVPVDASQDRELAAGKPFGGESKEELVEEGEEEGVEIVARGGEAAFLL